MRRVVVTVIVLAGLVACSRDEAAKKAPPTMPAGSAGAPGAGDRSGTSIANAKALTRGTPTTFTVPCNGAAVYVGPFALTRDPEKLVINADVKGTTNAQVCISSGHFVDAKDAHTGVAGIPCVEQGKPGSAKLVYEYSPGNGGNGATPVYWSVKHDEVKPPSCDTVTVTLTQP